MKPNMFLTSLVCAASLGIAGSALALAPPTPAELQGKIGELMAWAQAENPQDREVIAAKMEEVFNDLNFAELDEAGVQAVAGYIGLSRVLVARLNERIAVLAAMEDGPVGAAKASMAFGLAFQTEDVGLIAAAIRSTINHVGFEQAFNDGAMGQMVSMLGYLPEAAAVELKDEILGLAAHFDRDGLSAEALAGAGDYVVGLHKLREHISFDTRDAIRERVLARIASAVETTADRQLKDYLVTQTEMLESNFGKDLLLGNAAPEINFTWTNGSADLTKLSDLKGKVVVLDFWATWCAPCIASFPKVRELQAHYQGYDVVIVGITSTQERHITPDRQEIPIESAEQEHGLMAEYIGQQNMTWTVAFGEQEVFNPEYGARSIPHVAIIDAEGKLRYNAINAHGPLEEKIAKIDKLLEEAGLRTPGDDES